MNSNTVQERHLSHRAIFLQYKIENFFMQKIYIPGIWKPNIPKNIYLKNMLPVYSYTIPP